MADLETAAARLLTVGFPGKTLGPELRRLLERGIGAIILFGRNVGSPREVAELVRTAKEHAARPLLVAIDQEGGPVARLRDGFTPVPPMRALGATGTVELARAVGKVLGEELRTVGIDLDFAPVLDVDTNPENPVIGARSFSRDAERVALFGVALGQGMMEAGVAACGKHFPGHGDTHQDSHHELPRLAHGLERLLSVELVPFAAAVGAGFPSMMTAHVVLEALDAEWPATMSRKVVTGILRERLAFQGVVFTDDVEMKAIAAHFGVDELVARCLDAGVDSFLCCQTVELAHRLIDAIVAAVTSGRVSEQRLLEASGRVTALAERWAAPPVSAPDLSRLGCDEHRAVMERAQHASD